MDITSSRYGRFELSSFHVKFFKNQHFAQNSISISKNHFHFHFFALEMEMETETEMEMEMVQNPKYFHFWTSKKYNVSSGAIGETLIPRGGK